MKLLNILALFIIVYAFSSCHKDIDESSKSTTSITTPNVLKEIEGSIIGYVYDENNLPVENAKVKVYSGTTTTDKYGIFSFKNIKLDKHGTYLIAEKTGFIFGSDYIYPEKGINLSYINLLALDITGSFESGQGGEIEIKDGGRITFTSNSISKKDGSLYNGIVNVTAKRLSTDDKRISDKMPGDLRGENAEGSTVVLGTYGMVAVELRDELGIELNIKEGSTANIVFPITEKLKNIAPDEIPLWYFDKYKGIWTEEGKAILQDGNYIGDVTHFSWWNCDAPFPVVHMCVNILFENGNPAANYVVIIEVENLMSRTGYVNSEGTICGKIPKGKVLTLKVKNPFCDEIVKTITVGPFDNDVILDDIILPLKEFLGKGTVECNGTPLTDDAKVILNYTTSKGTSTIVVPVNSDGTFDLSFSPLNCDDILSAKLFAYTINGDASPTIELDLAATNNDIKINVCTDCSFGVEIKYVYTDNCLIDTITLEAIVDGSGDFSYLWSNGETTQTIKNVQPGLICVTVTETNAGCDNIKCKTINSAQNLGLDTEVAINPYCGRNNGRIFGFAWGGVYPYTYLVTGPNGFISNSFDLQELEAGEYVLQVTDELGCVKSKTITLVQDLNHEVTLSAFSQNDCETVKLFASVNSSGTLTYSWSDGQTGNPIYVINSGTYCVTVSEGSDCDIEECIEVETLRIPDVPYLDSCTAHKYYYNNYEYVDVYTQTNNQYNYAYYGPIEIDVLKDGYWFYVLYDQSIYCEIFEYSLTLPSLIDGVNIDSIANPTCIDCEDGKIFFTINSDNDCIDCEYGNTSIFEVNDLNTDLKDKNEQEELKVGNYYVVVTDKNTGCYIAHKYVELE